MSEHRVCTCDRNVDRLPHDITCPEAKDYRPPKFDSERMRGRVVHGWAFRDLHPDVVEAITAYLDDGNPDHLYGTTYATLRRRMYPNGEKADGYPA